MTFPKRMPFYLLVEAAGGLVEVDPDELLPDVSSLLQPVTKAPTVSANSTTRVYSLFIVAVTFTNSPKRTRTFFHEFSEGNRVFSRSAFSAALITLISAPRRS